MKGDLGIRLPNNISFEQGASIASGINTSALGMYSSKTLGLPIPTLPIQESTGEERFILIYGGSSASGSIAIQFAKLSVTAQISVYVLESMLIIVWQVWIYCCDNCIATKF